MENLKKVCKNLGLKNYSKLRKNDLEKLIIEHCAAIKIQRNFRNKLIDNNVYLAENCDSLADALDICLTWEKEGYNKNIYRNENKDALDYSFTLFSYINEYDIVKYDVEKNIKPEKEIKILGYKIDNIPKFTCLLEFKNEFDFF